MASDQPSVPSPSGGSPDGAAPAQERPSLPGTRAEDAWRDTLPAGDLTRKRRILEDMEAHRGQEMALSAQAAAPARSVAAGASPDAGILPHSAAVPATAPATALAMTWPRLLPAAGHGGPSPLEERAHLAESTCAMLEEEMARLERQALDAMAEAGRLRRALDEIERQGGGSGGESWWQEKASMAHRLQMAEQARDLLTSALLDSEAEIARLTKTLDMVARRFDVAV